MKGESSDAESFVAYCQNYRQTMAGIRICKVSREQEPEQVNLSTLTPVEKRTTWTQLKGTPLGDLLQEPLFQALAQRFDASIHVRKDDL